VGISILAWSITVTGNAAHKDFISYWAAGQLLLRHANPYDSAAVFRIEKSAGFAEQQPLIMRNPPFALILALPLGLLSARDGVVLWSIALVGALMASVRILWNMHGRPPSQLHLFAYVFAPAMACMQLGQTSMFALLGLAGFLSLYPRSRLAAGFCLPLLAIKPHLFIPFGLILLIWIFSRRAYAILLGAVGSAAPAALLAMWFHPSVWSDYPSVLRTAENESQFVPTVSALVRHAISPNTSSIQFLPALLGCLWAIWFFNRHSSDWDWRQHGLLLLLVSVFVAPYSWFTDEVVVLPALLYSCYLRDDQHQPITGIGVLGGIAVLLMLFGVQVSTGAYIWTTTAWLGWFVYATRGTALSLDLPQAALE
jgi:hypothetical protein